MRSEGDAWSGAPTGAPTGSADETVAGESLTIRRSELSLERGEVLGRYVVIDRIGVGGMGVVYAAYDPELDRKIALKLVRVAGGGTAGTRLLREAQAMARLAHPNVITIHDVGRIDEEVFLAMEYVEGASLTQWLRTARTWREVARVFAAAGEGLAAAHAAGLVHRDFKPDNVLVGDDGRVRVLDFGLARRDDAAEPVTEPESGTQALDSDLTRTGAVMGTPAYMSPEQHMGLPVDARTDQFSFCVALYEALFEVRPFEGRTPVELAMAVVEGRRREPPRMRDVPSRLARAVFRGLATAPEDRFPSMRELLRALSRAPRRNRWPWLAAGCAGLAVASLAYALAPSSEDEICGGAADQLAGVWDPRVDAAVQVRFAASEKPYATANLAAVRERLSGFVDRWTQTHTEACRATRVQGTQSEAVLDLRMACLDRAKHELAAITSVLEEADEGVVTHAIEIVQGLPALDRCSDLTALQSDVDPPAPEIEDAVREVRAETARVDALHRAGRVDEALSGAEALVDRARDLGYRPALAESLLTLAIIQEDSPSLSHTRDTLHETSETAIASGDRRVYVRSLLLLVRIEGYRDANYDGARWLTRMAEAEIHALDDEPKLLASLHSARGTLNYMEARFDEAIEDYEAALRLRRADPAVDALELADLEYNIGAVNLGLGRYRDAEDKYRAALATWTKAVGPDHPEVAHCHNNLSVALVRLHQYDEALVHAQKARAIWAASYGPAHPDTASAINNVADTLAEMGRYDEALVTFQEGIEIKRASVGAEHPDTLGAMSNLAWALHRAGRHEEAVEVFERVHETMARVVGPLHPKTLLCRLGLGDIALERDQLDEAIAILEALLVDVRRGPGEGHPMFQNVQTALSIAYTEAGRSEDALDALRQARAQLADGQSPATLRDIEERIAALEAGEAPTSPPRP